MSGALDHTVRLWDLRTNVCQVVHFSIGLLVALVHLKRQEGVVADILLLLLVKKYNLDATDRSLMSCYLVGMDQ